MELGHLPFVIIAGRVFTSYTGRNKLANCFNAVLMLGSSFKTYNIHFFKVVVIIKIMETESRQVCLLLQKYLPF